MAGRRGDAPLASGPDVRQLDLFESDVLTVDPTFSGVSRVRLDDRSWVDVVRNWMSGSDALLSCLLDAVPWEQRDRWMYDRVVDEPRLTAEFRTLDDAPHPMLVTMCAALSDRYGVPYDGLWLNLYRDHRDSTSWHGDRFSCRRPENIVPVLSLGARRRFLLRPLAGGASVALTVSAGDLVVMGGRCQAEWRHSVPKQARPCGPRVSVNVQSSWQARQS